MRGWFLSSISKQIKSKARQRKQNKAKKNKSEIKPKTSQKSRLACSVNCRQTSWLLEALSTTFLLRRYSDSENWNQRRQRRIIDLNVSRSSIETWTCWDHRSKGCRNYRIKRTDGRSKSIEAKRNNRSNASSYPIIHSVWSVAIIDRSVLGPSIEIKGGEITTSKRFANNQSTRSSVRIDQKVANIIYELKLLPYEV